MPPPFFPPLNSLFIRKEAFVWFNRKYCFYFPDSIHLINLVISGAVGRNWIVRLRINVFCFFLCVKILISSIRCVCVCVGSIWTLFNCGYWYHKGDDSTLVVWLMLFFAGIIELDNLINWAIRLISELTAQKKKTGNFTSVSYLFKFFLWLCFIITWKIYNFVPKISLFLLAYCAACLPSGAFQACASPTRTHHRSMLCISVKMKTKKECQKSSHTKQNSKTNKTNKNRNCQKQPETIINV